MVARQTEVIPQQGVLEEIQLVTTAEMPRFTWLRGEHKGRKGAGDKEKGGTEGDKLIASGGHHGRCVI